MAEKQTFESAFAELEKIVEELESGEIALEESITKFERGVTLYQFCRKELDKVEEKVKILVDKLKAEEEVARDEFLENNQ
ncbi:MAG: exodeoxyribonuclease VII small subunit [Candidatus Hydrogenedentota bacterium]